ncbi:MAG TPA: hypothetical protein VFI25_12155 [Planctomycetota bacterium]|jgi:hypothetical protein|nr:hypothetical protein [Planctomycetota bacterium]
MNLGVALLAVALASGEKSRDSGLWFEGRRIPYSSLPADLPSATRTVLERERAFAEKNGLRVYAKARGPVVLVSEWGDSQNLALLGDAERLAAEFPRLFPDPKEPPPLADEELDTTDPSAPFPLYLLSSPAIYQSLAQRLASEHEYLQGWAAKAARLQGFNLYRPRISVVLSGTYGDPHHWVVHNLTHVLSHPRYGRQPFWVEEGMAWYAEDALLRGVFAFCYRDNFLWDAEKSGWSTDFAGLFRSGKPRSVLDLASLRPGTYTSGEAGVKDPRALLAYGLVAYLGNERREEFAALLLAFAKDGAEQGGFEASYEVPVETQRKLLVEILGADLDKNLAGFAGRIGRDVPRPKALPPKGERSANGQ